MTIHVQCPWFDSWQVFNVMPSTPDTHAHTVSQLSFPLPSVSSLTCRKMGESFWYSFTSCRLAMVSITPMALPAIAMAMDNSTMWWHNGMIANTSEMMKVQESRAIREDRSLQRTQKKEEDNVMLFVWVSFFFLKHFQSHWEVKI